MFETLGYLLELTVSLYFLAVVTLFLINVCEFMPLNSHYEVGEEKITVRLPATPAPSVRLGSRSSAGVIKGISKSALKNGSKHGQKSKTDETESNPQTNKKEPTATEAEVLEHSVEPASPPKQQSLEENEKHEAAADEENAGPTAVDEMPQHTDTHEEIEQGEAAEPGEAGEPHTEADPDSTPHPDAAAEPGPTELDETAETNDTNEKTPENEDES